MEGATRWPLTELEEELAEALSDLLEVQSRAFIARHPGITMQAAQVLGKVALRKLVEQKRHAQIH